MIDLTTLFLAYATGCVFGAVFAGHRVAVRLIRRREDAAALAAEQLILARVLDAAIAEVLAGADAGECCGAGVLPTAVASAEKRGRLFAEGGQPWKN